MSLDDFNWLCSVWLSLSKSQYKVVKCYTAHFCDLKDLQFLKTKNIHTPTSVIRLYPYGSRSGTPKQAQIKIQRKIAVIRSKE